MPARLPARSPARPPTRLTQDKFGVAPGPEMQAVIRSLVQAYVEGLCWVMRYYYDGVASWTWFYPFHYAPFASGARRQRRVAARPPP